MKKLFRPFAALFSAALLLTSCIDNTVSDQVNKIREAQVNLLNAQTRLKEAEAAYKEAEAEGEEIANAKSQSELDLLVAKNAALIATEEQNLAEAIEELRVYLLEQGAESAADLLESYEAYMGEAYDVATDIAEDRATLARWNLLFTDAVAAPSAPVPPTTFALLEEELQRDLADEEAKLAAQENTLALMEEVAAGTADAEEELANLEAANQGLSNEWAALNVEKTKASNAIAALNSAADVNGDLKKDGIIPRFEAAEAAADEATAALTVANQNGVQAIAAAAKAKVDYDNAKQLLENYTAPLATKYTAFASALATAKTRFQAVKDRAGELEVLEAQKTAGGNVTDAQITAAEAAVTAAITTLEGSVGETNMDGTAYDLGDLSDLTGGTSPGVAPITFTTDSALDKAQKDYNPVKAYFAGAAAAYTLIESIGDYDETTFIAKFEAGNGVLANIPLDRAGEDLDDDGVDDGIDGGTLIRALILADIAAADKQADIATAQADLDEATAAVTAEQAAYDQAVLDLPGLQDDLDAIVAEQHALEIQISENDSVIDTLEGLLGLGAATTAVEVEAEANKAIEDKKNDIEDTKRSIAQIQKALDNNAIDLQRVLDYIAALEADIEEQEGQLAAYQALAAEYLELLNAELD
jgi:chromosome segregation ATPase